MNIADMKLKLSVHTTISSKIRACKDMGLTVSDTKTILEAIMERDFLYQHIRNVYHKVPKQGSRQPKKSIDEILNTL